MRDQHDLDRQLDDLLDALNGGEAPTVPDDPELAALVETASRLRFVGRPSMPEPDSAFPSRMAVALERELSRDITQNLSTAVIPGSSLPGKRGSDMPPPDDTPIPLPVRQPWLPETLRLVAAVALFLIVGALLVILMRGTNGGDDALIAGSGVTATSAEATATGLIPDASGIYHPASFAQAQTLVPFELLQAEEMSPLPEGLFLAAIEVQPIDDAAPAGASDGPFTVEAIYALGPGQGAIGMSQLAGACAEPDFENPTRSSVDIGGVVVTKIVGIPRGFFADISGGNVTMTTDQRYAFATYFWMHGETCVAVAGALQGQITESLIERFINALVTPPSFVSPSPTVRTSYSTFDEARPFVPFVLAEPVLGEDGIELTSVDVLSDAGTPAQVAGVAAYYLYYGAAQPIQFHQHLGACVDFSGENGPEITEQQTIELGGKFVRETHAVTKDGMPVADYRWGGNGVCYFVFGVVPDDVALDRIQQLVGAIPLSPSVDGPAATATFSVPEISAFTDDRALVTITLDYGHGDTSIVLRGRGFTPETSVSIFAGPFVGDSEPRWMVDETVLADGTFSLALAPEALAKWCDETTPDRACRISATPGRVTQMPDTAEPSAFTVFTFAEHTPDEVLNRAPLPSCGVAVSLDGPQGDNGEDARRCFVAAVIAGRSAELVTHQQMVEGDIVTAIYRTTGDGVVLRYADATRDRFGSGIWTVTSCQASRDANQDPGDLRFPRCDAAVPLD